MPTATRRVTTVVDGTPQGGGKVIFVLTLTFFLSFSLFFLHFISFYESMLEVEDFK